MNTIDDPIETKHKENATDVLTLCSDADLLDAWTRDKLPEAFTVLVQRHGVMVWTVCRRKCLTHSDADDAYQTTFLVLAKNGGRIRRPECLAGWLHRVAQRASTATLSRKAQCPESPTELAMIDDPLDKITQQHDAIVLDEELSALPDHYRAALVMHVYQDCPLQQMADHFQTSLGTIRGRLQRGKKLLAGRLRRRGIVPVLAVAAAGVTTLHAGEASAAGAALLDSIGNGLTPSPPIPENLLHPLVASGKRIMTPWNAAGGLAAAGTIAAMLVLPGDGSVNGQTERSAPNTPISIGAEREPLVAQFAAPPNPASAMGTSAARASSTADDTIGPQNSAGENQSVLRRRYRPATATGPLAESLLKKMDEPVELNISGTLDSLVDQLESELEQPVILSDRVIKYVQLEPTVRLSYKARSEPLRTALRKLLRPLGLKATVETEAIVITADHNELVHRGIGSDQWLNVNDELMRRADQDLSRPLTVQFVENPLKEAIDEISSELTIPIRIDRRAMEEIGLDDSAQVTIEAVEQTAYDVITLMLSDLDMAIHFKNGVHVVTTREWAEGDLLSRVYWLEGTGVNGDYDSMMNLIQTIIQPDTWEALGGSSAMAPAPGHRPGLVVSTTYEVHREIEQLIRTLRENSFSLDAVAEEVETTAPANSAGAIGGGGFM